jgi:hypothetical protein
VQLFGSLERSLPTAQRRYEVPVDKAANGFPPVDAGRLQYEWVRRGSNALDARRQRIILSRERVNWVKWTSLFVQAGCVLIAIAIIHSANRAAAAVAMGIFATGLAVSLLLIASHDRPFNGEVSVKPDLLLQVRPQ